ncbi:DUF1002 domain-containing protein [Pseudogracilibacillus sp. SE30717A]|uniref:DUF1002 domain-containing protein n=1 Tax=Pseudogracilibacillus sp. SE30717A TaxID=3098293 RepID=UPI00300DFC7F
MKYISKLFIMLTFVFGLAFSSTLFVQSAYAKDEGINELLGAPIVVYGGNLTEDQKAEVRRILDVDQDNVTEMEVTGKDIAHYIDGNPNSNMYSSVKITHKDKGHGIVVNIVTADNITQVTSEMYSNALLTAGVENALIEVASPLQVTGHSALTGIYKAYDAAGADLDKDRMEVANDELSIATELSEKEGLTQETVTELMTEIKKAIADQDPATREDVEKIVQEQLDKLEINLSEEDRQLLTDLFERMRELDIDFDKVKQQLEDITSTIKDRLGDINIDEGFWDKVSKFFQDLIDSIAGLFKG